MNSIKKISCILLGFFMLVFIACKDAPDTEATTDFTTEEESMDMTVEENEGAEISNYSVTVDPEFEYDPNSFYYEVSERAELGISEATVTPVSRPARKTAKTYTLPEVDRLPLFSEACLGEKDQEDCLNDAIRDYFRKNINYPDAAEQKRQNGTYYVTFVVDKNGKIGKDFKVTTKKDPCEGCAKAAVDAVANMPQWVPAIKDGKPVKVELTLPVKFQYLEL